MRLPYLRHRIHINECVFRVWLIYELFRIIIERVPGFELLAIDEDSVWSRERIAGRLVEVTK